MSNPNNENPEPPAKRRRDDLESSHEEIVKHGTLYFENGNIVLLSLPKDDTITAFKVYKEYLLLQSTVFEGMLSIPSPPSMELYDNVPLVRLQDELDELTHFLEAIYDPTAIPTKRDFYNSTDKVRSVFKLSKKYQADKLLRCVKDTLSEIWPTSLVGWDIINNGQLAVTESHRDTIKYSFPEPCFMIRLAREYDVPEILPMAFYHLFCITTSAFSRTAPGDGDHWGLQSRLAHPTVNFKDLSREDLMVYTRGSHAIRQWICDLASTATDLVAEDPDLCETDTLCFEALLVFEKIHVYTACLEEDAMDLLRAQRIMSLNPTGICPSCLSFYVDHFDGSRTDFWNNLSKFFGL